MARPTLEALDRHHRPLLKDFCNQAPSLVDYLQRFALRHSRTDLLARTWLAVDRGAEPPRVAGYFSLCPVSVERASVDTVPSLQRLPRFPIPGILLARLAVDDRIQGQGLGTWLLGEALGMTLQLARSGPLGFRVMVTDALDEGAARFYQRFGLQPTSDGWPARMVLDLKAFLEAEP